MEIIVCLPQMLVLLNQLKQPHRGDVRRRAVRMHANTRGHVSVRQGRSSFEGSLPTSNLIVIRGGVTCLPACLEERCGEQHGPTDDLIAPKQLFIHLQL